MNRKQIPTKEEGQGGSQRSLDSSPELSHERVGKYCCQKKMNNDNPIEGKIQRQEKIRQTERVEHPGLNGSEKRNSTFNIRVPEREIPLAQCLNPDETKRIKETGKISLDQKDLTSKYITEI